STGTAAADSGGAAQEAAARSEEEIRKIMEQHKRAIFSIYNRALRQNPALHGKVVVNIIIESSGKISDVRLVSSELRDPVSEARLSACMRAIRVPASGRAGSTLAYPV